MLPKGIAQKVTIYVNQDTRAHTEPLWSTILNFLRSRHVAGATLFWADMGFGSHEQVHNPQSEYAGQHRPVRIEFIETLARVEELMPTLYEMVTDGLITVQDLKVIKAVSKDHSLPEPPTAAKVVASRAKLVRIYVCESDKYKDETLYEAIVKRARMIGCSGATVHRGILGYGAKGHTHKTGRFHAPGDLPVLVSIIEKPDKISELIQVLSDLISDGLIVTSDVELHQSVHESLPGANEKNEQPPR